MKMPQQPLTTMKTPALLIAAILLGFTGCRPHSPPVEQSLSDDTAAISVATITLEEVGQPLQTHHLGTLQTAQRAIVPSRLNANILSIDVKVGDRVTKEDILVHLDDREWRAAVDQAQAEWNRAEADWNRYQQLLAERSVTQREADLIRTAFETARAHLKATNTRLSHTLIKAPFDGVIEHVYAEAGEGVGMGQPLVAIEHPGQLEVSTHLPMTLAHHLKTGSPLDIYMKNGLSKLEGTITELPTVADPTTRTMEIVLQLPSSAVGVRPGDIVRVAVPSGEVQGIWIPTSTIQRRGQLEFVFLVQDAKASMRLIKTGKHQMTGDLTQILSGLREGEQLITSPLQGLTDGQSVSAAPAGKSPLKQNAPHQQP